MRSGITVALVCGEASGDALGAGLATELKQRAPGIELVGVTGPLMREAGVRSWLNYDSFAVMGYAAVLRQLPSIWRARNTVIAALRHTKPQVFVGLDAPDLNLGLGQRVATAGGRYVQYVCPSFWLWRPNRAHVLARHCSKVLSVLPFEVAQCIKANIPVQFVGHRLAAEIPPAAPRRAAARQELGINAAAQVLALLPGSRHQELVVHEPLFRAVALQCQQELPGLEIWSAPLGAGGSTSAGAGSHSCPGQARSLLAAADVALVKSGTITLEAALLDCPQVVAYRLSSLSSLLVRWRLGDIHARSYSLPNLVVTPPFVPEFIQERATPARLAAAVKELFGPAQAAALRTGYTQVRAALAGDTDALAAAAVLEVASA